MSKKKELTKLEIVLVDDAYLAMDRIDAARSCGLPLDLVSERYDELDALEDEE